MSAPPKVFISATSGDLGGIRQVVKETLLTINCHPVEQTNFAPDWRTVEGMLRGKIEDCQALIHIVGMRYGAEPDPATLPPGTPRRSYTQMEYHIGLTLHEQRSDAGFRVYAFVCPEDFPYDVPLDHQGNPLPPEDADKLTLQLAHRDTLTHSRRFCEEPENNADFRNRILALQEQVISLQIERDDVRHEVRNTLRKMLMIFGIALVLLGSVIGVHIWRLPPPPKGLVEAVDTVRIRAHLRESSERKLNEDLAAASKVAHDGRFQESKRMCDRALAAHETRLARIDELAASFAVLDGQADVSPVLKEMIRILEKEGVDHALDYANEQEPEVLKTIVTRKAATLAAIQERNRRDLQPMLKAAQLRATKGQIDEARASCLQILEVDPEWPEALQLLASFISDQRRDFWSWGPRIDLETTLAQARATVTLAEKLQAAGPHPSASSSVLANALTWYGDVLDLREQPGDPDRAREQYTRGLQVAKDYLQANPDSPLAMRDVSVSLSKLGDSLSLRGQPGDAEAAMQYYAGDLEMAEKILSATPKDCQAKRDLSVSLYNLACFLLDRGGTADIETARKQFTRCVKLREEILQTKSDSTQALRDLSKGIKGLGDYHALTGDDETALRHYSRSLQIRDDRLRRNPDSEQAKHDVATSLNDVAGILSRRNQPGDADRAFQSITRGRTICEEVLQGRPDSVQAKRDIATNLQNSGDLLVARGQPGDAETAVKHCARSLQIREEILAANQPTAQSRLDVASSLRSLADALALRGQPGDAEDILHHYQRCLEQLDKLALADPESARTARALWMVCRKLAMLAERSASEDSRMWWRRAHDILNGLASKGKYVSAQDLRDLETIRAKAKF